MRRKRATLQSRTLIRATRISRAERSRALEQALRVVMRYFGAIGSSNAEIGDALQVALRQYLNKPFHSSENRRYQLWLVLGDLIDTWTRDPAFCLTDGTPRALPFEGPASFKALVGRFLPAAESTDIAAFLESSGVLAIRHGTVSLRGKAVRQLSMFLCELNPMTLERVPVAINGMLSTMLHNQRVHGEGSRLELSVQIRALPEELIGAFDTAMKRRGFALATDVNGWLLRRQRPTNAGGPLNTARATVSVFAEIEPNEPQRRRAHKKRARP